MCLDLPSCSEVSKIIFNGTVINSLKIQIISIDILFQPCTSFGSNDFIIGNISFSNTLNEIYDMREMIGHLHFLMIGTLKQIFY